MNNSWLRWGCKRKNNGKQCAYRGDIETSCASCKHAVPATGESLYIINDIEPHFNRGLGEFVKSRRDYKQKLKERNLEEVGNEDVSPEKYRKEKEREQEKVLMNIRPEAHKMLNYYEERSQWN